jgi:hypothetical protein
MLVVNGMTPRATYEGFLKTSATDLESVFAAYGGPILLTHGAHDRFVRRAMTERIRSLKPGSHLSVFAESGHSPFYEEGLRQDHGAGITRPRCSPTPAISSMRPSGRHPRCRLWKASPQCPEGPLKGGALVDVIGQLGPLTTQAADRIFWHNVRFSQATPARRTISSTWSRATSRDGKDGGCSA